MEVACGQSRAIHDRDMSPGTYMWLSVKVADLSWSQPFALRDGALSGEAGAGVGDGAGGGGRGKGGDVM